MTTTTLAPSRFGARTRDLALTFVVVVLAGLAGFLAVRQPVLGLALAVVPAVVWLFVNWRIAAVLLAVTLPFVADVTGGRLGLNVAVSDLLLVLVFVAIATRAILTRRGGAFRALGPVKTPLLQYIAVMLVILAYHVGLGTSIKTGQRLELFALPLVIGAAVAFEGYERWVLRAYVLGATALAALWPFMPDLGQKNPSGQFMATGILILVGTRATRKLLPYCLPVLVFGLLWTLSRGAIVSVGVGLIALLLIQRRLDRRWLVLVVVPLAALTFFAFRALPEEGQSRLLTYSSGTGSSAEWAVKIRHEYSYDARAIIREHPLFGIGVGRYLAGTPSAGTQSTDPHQVLLLQAAEGGYALAVSFVLLILGTVAVLVATARRTELGPLAAAVTLAVVSHGLVDVYWVRGTPVMAWLLVGMALGQLARERQGSGRA